MGIAHQNYLKGQIALREQRLASVEADLVTASATELLQSLDSRARQLTTEIDNLDAELREDERNYDLPLATVEIVSLELESTRIRNIENRWQEYLHHVDHTTAKNLTEEVFDRLRSDPGDALFVFQDSKEFLGDRYIEYLKNLIKSSRIGCCSPPCQVGLLKSQPDSAEFLSEFAGRFKVEKPTAQDFSIDLVLDGIKGVLESCTIFFLEVNLSDFDENHTFIDWFIKHFWYQLLDRIAAIRQRNPLFVCIGAITLDSEIEDDFLQQIRSSFSDSLGRFVVFKNEVWEADEVREWMRRYSGIPLPWNEEIERIPQRVYRYQRGIPSRAEEKLREELKRLVG
jgi:hypothetical protein